MSIYSYFLVFLFPPNSYWQYLGQSRRFIMFSYFRLTKFRCWGRLFLLVGKEAIEGIIMEFHLGRISLHNRLRHKWNIYGGRRNGFLLRWTQQWIYCCGGLGPRRRRRLITTAGSPKGLTRKNSYFRQEDSSTCRTSQLAFLTLIHQNFNAWQYL